MKKIIFIFSIFLAVGGFFSRSFAQISPELLSQREKWEEFLRSAEIIDQEQMASREAVTNPWKLTLRKDELTKYALWKNPQGHMKGYMEGWQWEIAAYRIDKLLETNMILPTVEKRFKGNRGSCQLWVDVEMSGKEKQAKKIKVPLAKLDQWNKMMYIKYAFDNLIANEDRHLGNILIDKEWRCICIDHSRSFRTSRRFVKKLIYTEKHKKGPMVMKMLPRTLLDKLETLNFEIIKDAVGEYLVDKEIKAVLLRRDLILQEMEKRIKENGEENVIY